MQAFRAETSIADGPLQIEAVAPFMRVVGDRSECAIFDLHVKYDEDIVRLTRNATVH